MCVWCGCVWLIKENKSRNCFHQSGKTHEKERTNRELSCVRFRAHNWREWHCFPPWVPVSCCQWFGTGCMRVFPRLARVACFAALGTGLMLPVVWCRGHAHFLALNESRMVSRPYTGVMLFGAGCVRGFLRLAPILFLSFISDM